MLENQIYLDYNASTPVLPEVLEAMLPYFNLYFGNAASKTHAHGWIADEAVSISREQVAELIGVSADEIVFTSGATESLNIAIRGVANAYLSRGKHFVTLATEHKAVLDTCDFLVKQGFEVTKLQVDSQGFPSLEELNISLREDTVALICMLANNETGRILPIADYAQFARNKGVLVICDATQAVGKIPVNALELGADLLAISAHKVYGPKGIGALYVKRRNPRVRLAPILFGGGHEHGIRPGSLATPLIVGFGKAAVLARRDLNQRHNHFREMRDILEQELVRMEGVTLLISDQGRLPNTSNICISGIKADSLFSLVPNLSFSSGSACTSALKEPSHVLLAMGLNEDDAYASIRLSTGIETHSHQVLSAASSITEAVRRLR